MNVHVVSHTHWDREWYHPAERFRQRLVGLIDGLLDDPEAPKGFLLDGQAVVLEDYLDVRPERASDVATALREGRVEAGPWFVLADELVPGGEGLVRNLLAGRRVLQRLRASAPPVLYCPDSFGHPAALPELARGFGKSLVILWRGLGGSRSPAESTLWWRSADGERVLLYHLTRSGYELGANLPTGAEEAAARWRRISAEFADRANAGVALLLNGADHHAPQQEIGRAIQALAGATRDAVTLSCLAQFADALVQAASGLEIPTIDGELRDSYGYTWTLQGTLASRAGQKRRYAQRERELVRDVEPWAALASLNASRSFRHLVNAAWRPLLLCQPHDTLCGCSSDQVARAMDHRLESVTSQAEGLREITVHSLIGHDADAARATPASWQPLLVVRNSAPRARSGVVSARLTLKLADVPVGPGSAHVRVPRPRADVPRVSWPVGEPVQLLDMTLANERTESPRDYPDNDAVVHFDAALWVDDVPAYGILSLPFDGARHLGLTEQLVSIKGRCLTNGRITLRWDASGRLTLEDHVQGRTIRSLISWESRRDAGDLYTPAVRQRKFVPRFVGTRVVHRGSLRGVIEQRWKLSGKLEHVEVRVRFSLDAGAEWLRISVDGENAARDHRLRLHVRTDVREGATIADAAFGVVARERLDVAAADARMEHPAHTAPLHRYVSRFDAHRGATLFSDGLAEYETLREGFAVTILRAVGELSRSDLPERPGHAGWPMPTPEAQCIGPFAAEFALLLHGPRTATVVHAIEATADDVLQPLRGETLRSALRIPDPVHGISLDGEGLAFSAAKESEDGEWVVLRCVNLLDREVAGSWRLGGMLREAKLARLDETPLTPLEVSGDRVRFVAPAHAVMTILAR